MIIFDEEQYIKKILDTREIPKNVSDFKLISYIAKYYYGKISDEELYIKLVFDVLCDFDSYYKLFEYKYNPMVQKICHNFFSGKWDTEMFLAKPVTIYKEEMEVINQCDTLEQQKVLFVLYVLAKIRTVPNGWVNYQHQDIKKISNLNLSNEDWLLVLHQLYKNNFMTISKNPHKTGFKVPIKTGGEQFTVINKFENLGKQYMVLINSSLMLCENCGKLIYRKNNRQKFCKKCYKKTKKH